MVHIWKASSLQSLRNVTRTLSSNSLVVQHLASSFTQDVGYYQCQTCDAIQRVVSQKSSLTSLGFNKLSASPSIQYWYVKNSNSFMSNVAVHTDPCYHDDEPNCR